VKILPNLKNRWFSQSSLLILGIVVFFALALLWSVWAELDQVSRAPGQVIPTGRTNLIQSTDGGVITDILVKEGDQVRKGQLLVRLDQVKLRASVGEAQGKVASLMSSMARINAELFDRPLAFPPEVQNFPDFVANQSMLYTKRRQALQDQIGSLRSQLTLIRQELDMNMPLLAQGDVSRADVLRLQRGVSDIEAQMVNVRNKYLQDLQAEYTKTEEDLVTAREILAQRSDALKDTEVRAPVDGIVKNIRLTTVGGVLRASDEVMTIVPTGEQLILETRLSPTDRAYVKLGQPATVKFDAYDSGIYGTAAGTVTYISPDTITEQKAQGDAVYYRVHVRADTSRMKPHRQGEKIDIQPGMTAVAEIQTGRNTVWHYLTKPINKTFGEAMTER
jgi:adhesin transport system membrane fusion protein